MITIYVLIDPRTNIPFYVGATSTKLKWRLNAHLRDSQIYYYTTDHMVRKAKIISQIISSGNEVLIKPVFM